MADPGTNGRLVSGSERHVLGVRLCPRRWTALVTARSGPKHVGIRVTIARLASVGLITLRFGAGCSMIFAPWQTHECASLPPNPFLASLVKARTVGFGRELSKYFPVVREHV
jgi:hypothetical protein